MRFKIFPILSALVLLLGACSEPAEEANENGEFDDLFCDQDLASLDIGEDYYEIIENPLIMAGALVHANRFEAGSELDLGEGCVLAQADFEDGDRLYVNDFTYSGGPFSSRYHFILDSEMLTNNFIALNSFDDIDAIAHELGYVPEGVRVFHLEQFYDDEIRIYKFFAGEPSVNELLKAVSDILSLSIDPLAIVVLGEEFEIILSEEFFNEEEPIS